MSDREKLIRKLQDALENAEDDGEIYAEIRRPVLFEAILMLKEQKAVEPRKIKGFQMPLYLRFGYECGNCETPLLKDQPYCAGCGKPVKWDG